MVLLRTGVEERAGRLGGAPVPGGELASGNRRVGRRKGVGEVEHDLIEVQILERGLEIKERARDGARQSRLVRDDIAHERQVATHLAERVSDQAGVDVDDPVAEPGGGAGVTVMQFVRMQDEDLAGGAVRRGASILERLHAMQRDADRVGVMAMRIIAMTREERLDPFQARARRRDLEPVRRVRSARSFKTAGCGAIYARCHAPAYQNRLDRAR
jgi:hypothetical protein